MSAPPRVNSSGLIPELGPALGRLCSRPQAASGRWVSVDDIRLDLVTRIFELAGAARGFAIPRSLWKSLAGRRGKSGVALTRGASKQ